MTMAGGIFGGGGFAGGPASVAQGRAAGLPFGGIPSEMQEGVDRLLAGEPDHGVPDVHFRQRPGPEESRRLTLWSMLSRFPRLLLFAGAFVVVWSVALQTGPYLTDVAINHGMLPGHRHLPVVALAAGAYLACAAAAALSQRFTVILTGRLAAGVMHELRVRVFAHLQRLSLDFYTEEQSGVLMSRMTSDIENLQQLLQDGLTQLAVQALTMVVITGVLFFLNIRLALITVALIVPLLTAASLWFRSASERGYQRVRDGISVVLADLSENLHGIRTVVASNRQERNLVHHREVLSAYREANMYTGRLASAYGPATQGLGLLGQAALLSIGGDMVAHRTLSIGALVAFFLYLNRFLQPIQLLVQQYNTFQQGHASVIKLRSLLSTSPSVEEAPDAVELPPIKGRIAFEHVCFGYEKGSPVLDDVDLVIEPGETVAFVGPTGAGKSTLAKLITRFYDVTEGSLRIDDHDVRSVTLESLRRQIGVVPQEPFLFAGTIRDNITFGRPSATDEEVEEAVQAVGLPEVIERLPAGVESVVHERGQTLSSGERQLVALARAFLARPRVVVLDEATSNLDLQSEARIEAALERLIEGRTAVLIAHRLSTAMKADRIVVVLDGRIAEVGSHDELVAAGGAYAAMYRTWISHGGGSAPVGGLAAPRPG
jgi:ATP-binding cassette subfamily B protein